MCRLLRVKEWMLPSFLLCAALRAAAPHRISVRACAGSPRTTRDGAARREEEKEFSEDKNKGGMGEIFPQRRGVSAPDEDAVTPLLVGVLVHAAHRTRRTYLPRADQLQLNRGGGGDPDGGRAAGQGSMSDGTRDGARVRLDATAREHRRYTSGPDRVAKF